VTITQTTDLYNHHPFFETILTSGIDDAASQITNSFWYLDDGDLLPCHPTAAYVKEQRIHHPMEPNSAEQIGPTLWPNELQHL